jgi:hypothetical protein
MSRVDRTEGKRLVLDIIFNNFKEQKEKIDNLRREIEDDERRGLS